MNTQIKIAKSIADTYNKKSTCTLDISQLDFVQLNGHIIKNNVKADENYVTIRANEGGAFSTDWEKSSLKILYILRESYILKESFYEDEDRGGHKQNEEYDNNGDLWRNATYRNLVKITYFTYNAMFGISLKEVDFTQDEVWDDACCIFRKHAAVINANPFPGLAFNSTKTDITLLKQWFTIPEIQNLLKEKVQQLSPKRIYSAFDLGLVSSYPHLFGWLKGRPLKELVDYEGEQNVLGREIVIGGVEQGKTFAVDKKSTIWIQGVHPSSRLSHKCMRAFSSVLYHP